MNISTFHAFCQQLLEENGLDIGLPNRFQIITEAEGWLMLREHLYDLPLNYYRPLGNPVRHVYELLRHFSKCKDELISPDDYLAYAEGKHLDNDELEESSRLQEVANIYHAYNQLLREKGILDFGDLISYSVKMLRERRLVAKKIHDRFRFVLVDEFQDVNYAQYELVKLLTPDAQLTVVGDDDQSIYAFRGASVSNILHFKRDFPDAKEIVLNENYRSGQEILDAAYRLIQGNNPDRLEVKLQIDKKLLARKILDKEKTIKYLPTPTGDEEVQAVVSEIKKLKKEIENLAWNEIAILVRANNHAEPFSRAFESEGIPYEFLTSVGLYRKKIVFDCFHILCAIDNPFASLSLYHLLRLPVWTLSDEDLLALTFGARRKSISLFEAIKKAAEFSLSAAGLEICRKILQCLSRGREQARLSKPTTVLLQFWEASGYMAFFSKLIDEGDQDAIRSAFYLRQFFDLLSRYEETVIAAHISGFLEYYRSILESGDEGKLVQSTDTADAVNILTVHGAKGLEFRVVFIVNCVEQRFPVHRRSEAIELPLALIKEELPEGDYHYEEERRLFYVAMTRAKDRLYFTSAGKYGGRQEKKLSRFLVELGYDQTSDIRDQILEINKINNTKFYKTSSDLVTSPSAFVYSIPKSFSFSQIRSFETCPYQYKMIYLLKIPLSGNPYFSFGTSIHVTLQHFYEQVQERNQVAQGSLFDSYRPLARQDNQIQVPTSAELLQLFENHWIDEWYMNSRQRQDYYAKGKNILKQFYENNQNRWTIPLAIEQGFKTPISQYTITGKIDRIDKTSAGDLHIIDYKTGKSKKTVTGLEKKQLLLYQLAISQPAQFLYEGKVGQLTYYYLEDDLETSFLGTEDDLLNLTRSLEETITKIINTDFSAITRADACGRCEFCAASQFRDI